MPCTSRIRTDHPPRVHAGDTFLLKAENDQYSDLTIPAAEMTERTVGRVIWVLQNLSPM